MLRVIFYPTTLNKEDQAVARNIQRLDAVRNGTVSAREPLKTNARKIADKFKSALSGTPYKVVKSATAFNGRELTSAVEMDIIALRPASHNAQVLFDEMSFMIDRFEAEHGLPRKTRCELAAIRL